MSIEISEQEADDYEEIKEEQKEGLTDSSKYFIESNFIMEDMNEENQISSNSKSAGRRQRDLRKKKVPTFEESKERSIISAKVSSNGRSPFRRSINNNQLHASS
jgi:hypothetical protein